MTTQRPVIGRTYTRKQWQQLAGVNPESSQVKDHSVQVNVNYRCDGTYCPEQRVTALGYTVTVWHPQNTMVSARDIVHTKREVPVVIQQLIRKVDRRCAHPRTRELSAAEAAKHGVQHFGHCYHVEQCLKCHAVYAYDTSD